VVLVGLAAIPIRPPGTAKDRGILEVDHEDAATRKAETNQAGAEEPETAIGIDLSCCLSRDLADEL
jgi:hypothetical protein